MNIYNKGLNQTFDNVVTGKIKGIDGVPILEVVNPDDPSTSSIEGSNLCGFVSVSTGTESVAGKICDILFSKPRVLGDNYVPIISQSILTTPGRLYWKNNDELGFDVFTLDVPADNDEFQFSYFIASY